MGWMVWSGAALTLAGLGALVYCIAVAARSRAKGLRGPAMQIRLRRLVAVNLAALALSAIGLMAVVVGVMLS